MAATIRRISLFVRACSFSRFDRSARALASAQPTSHAAMSGIGCHMVGAGRGKEVKRLHGEGVFRPKGLALTARRGTSHRSGQKRLPAKGQG
jgi:hypothetical protein